MVIAKDYLETPCQIQSPNNKLLCVGKLASIGDNFVVLTKSSADDFPPIKFLSFVKMTMKHKTAGYKVILGSVTEATPSTIRLSSMILLTDDERRGYFRLHIEEPTILYLTDSQQAILDMKADIENAKSLKGTIDAPMVKYVNATIKNISLSGLLLETDEFLQIGQHVYVEIQTKRENELFAVTVRRRVDKNETASSIMGLAGSEGVSSNQYGCVIKEKNDRKMDDLCRTILEKQAVMIQRMKK